MTGRVDMMGCEFDVVTESQAVEQVFSWTQSHSTTSHTIITVNVAILMMARQDVRLARAISLADLVLVDGKPLVWASGWLGTPIPERVSGVDLMQRLLEVGKDRGLRVFFLGTTQERLDALERVVRDRYPGLVIAGTRNGFFGNDEYETVITQIREAKADLLLVGMPAPFKEVWCEEHREALATPAILGVGGAFDVEAGFVPRAPRWAQEAGMEWAWRLAMEPRKLWKRYLVTNSAFVLLLSRRLLKRRA
jgi:N-acetylglucosaminyldiphosphoundecaprenol N-acetyl-beta-D-mannosaminyltransferase